MKKIRLFLFLALMATGSLSFAQQNWYVSPTGNNANDGSAGNPWATIKGAVGKAEVTDNDIINVAAGTYTEVNITIGKNLTILGAGAGNTIVQAQETAPTGNAPVNNKRVFTLSSPANVIIKNLTIQHGNIAGGGGGGVRINGGCALEIDNCNILNCFTDAAGGGISCNGNLTISNSAICNNSSAGNGGGINISGSNQIANVSISNCLIYQNTSAGGNDKNSNGGGGAMFAIGGTNSCNITINNNTVAYNTGTHANNNNAGIRVENKAKIISLTNNLFFNSPNNESASGIDVAATATLLPEANALLNNIYSFAWAAPMNSTTIPSTTSDPKPTEAQIKFGTFTQAEDGLWSLPLLAGSIAIDAADANTATSTDMHGTNRGSTPDIGAFEYRSSTNIATQVLAAKVYPSPSTGTFKLHLSDARNGVLEIYSLTGQKVYQLPIVEETTTVELPVSLKGMVILRVVSNGATFTQKHLIN